MIITHKEGDSWQGFVSRLFDYVVKMDSLRYKITFEVNTSGAILINGYELTPGCTVAFAKTDVAVYVTQESEGVKYLVLQERGNEEN